MKRFNMNICHIVIIILIFFGLCILLYVKRAQRYEHFIKHKPMLNKISDKIKLMTPYFTDEQMSRLSKLKLESDIKSFTIDKSSMHLCLHDKKGKYYDENILMYVTLHELAHIFCDEIGHTEKYYSIFTELLEIAHSVGIYDKTLEFPSEYCGVKL